MSALLEVCCGSLESVEAAVRGGARRIELCSALEVDGLTPSPEDVQTVRERYPDLIVHVLIRLREGDFCYTPEEVDRMADQVEAALEAGAHGVVIGCLTPKGEVDMEAMETLVSRVEDFDLARELVVSDRCHAANDGHFSPAASRHTSITFHRAFDRCRRPMDALEDIISLGCDRLLTSGQAPAAVEGTDLLRKLVESAGDDLIIMPGGGVRPGNARRILLQTGAREIHSSASETVDGVKVTSAATVAAILEELAG